MLKRGLRRFENLLRYGRWSEPTVSRAVSDDIYRQFSVRIWSIRDVVKLGRTYPSLAALIRGRFPFDDDPVVETVYIVMLEDDSEYFHTIVGVFSQRIRAQHLVDRLAGRPRIEEHPLNPDWRIDWPYCEVDDPGDRTHAMYRARMPEPPTKREE